LIESSFLEKVKQMPARSYGQFCGLARALDAVGDRWSLLIVRELLPGPMRYSELMASLGGIATNLLADRLRSLESSGVIERRLGQTSGVVYALTPWGSQLREAIEALIRWSIPLMASGRGGDALQPRWLAVALEALLRGRTAKPPAELGIEVAGSFMTLRIGKDGPHVTVQPDRRPDTILKAEPEAVLRLAAGAITIDQALSRASVHGDPRVLTTVLGAAQT
jgi:DNA-binding HxlR family transcriptional regulator